MDKNKANAILEAKSPSNKKELQRFLGQINFFRRFICNCPGRTKAFLPLLKLKNQDEFIWKEKCQKAFHNLKTYLTSPPVLVSPIQRRPRKIYISAKQESIVGMVTQEDRFGEERAIYYLSR